MGRNCTRQLQALLAHVSSAAAVADGMAWQESVDVAQVAQCMYGQVNLKLLVHGLHPVQCLSLSVAVPAQHVPGMLTATATLYHALVSIIMLTWYQATPDSARSIHHLMATVAEVQQ
jgi:hypothetical protein